MSSKSLYAKVVNHKPVGTSLADVKRYEVLDEIDAIREHMNELTMRRSQLRKQVKALASAGTILDHLYTLRDMDVLMPDMDFGEITRTLANLSRKRSNTN